MALYALPDKMPQIDETAWVAPNATVIGDIRLAAVRLSSRASGRRRASAGHAPRSD